MRKIIGYGALVVGIIDLFTLMFLMFAGKVVGEGGFSTAGAFCFALWFVCVFTVIFCLIVPFIKKVFGNGFNSGSFTQNTNAVQCSRCGKYHDSTMAFCPHCGTKQ